VEIYQKQSCSLLLGDVLLAMLMLPLITMHPQDSKQKILVQWRLWFFHLYGYLFVKSKPLHYHSPVAIIAF
jgi:hypothetical protein